LIECICIDIVKEKAFDDEFEKVEDKKQKKLDLCRTEGKRSLVVFREVVLVVFDIPLARVGLQNTIVTDRGKENRIAFSKQQSLGTGTYDRYLVDIQWSVRDEQDYKPRGGVGVRKLRRYQ